MNSKSIKRYHRRTRPILAIIMALIIMGGIMVRDVFSNGAYALPNPEPVGGNYYISDFETKEEALAAGTEINEDIMGEGITLLKNEDDALPFGRGAKVSLFGKNSVNLLHGGSGSGSGSGGAMLVTMPQALTEAGFEVNPTLVNFYKTSASGNGRGVAPTNGKLTSGYNTGETPVSHYNSTIENSYSTYNDAAIVVFSRIGGEGFDLPRTMMWNGSDYRSWSDQYLVPGARSKDDHYLQLDQNESDLLKYLGSKFDKVVVILNTGSQFETGFLDDPDHYGYHENIKAALWIGFPGETGLLSLGKILAGEINPSGKTVDTYARNFKLDPVMKNFGDNGALRGNQYSNLPATGGNGEGGYRNNYVYYKEGIYMGYRYYETRGFTDGEEWYNNNVVYPFGYGLSYTTFSQSIVAKSPDDGETITDTDTINITVKVTNTGRVAGKEVVQLYYTTPYYAGGIEKAHVVLGNFAKTKLLAPNESQEVVVSIDVREMASYDFSDANNNGFKGYELEAGAYTIRIMNNAHDEIDSITYNIATDITCPEDSATGNAVVNRFDEVSDEIDTYLSRNDWEGTFPTTELKIAASQEIVNKLAEWLDNNPSDEGKPYYSNTKPKLGNNTGSIKLPDLIGKDYDDPLWDQFLDQLSRDTMRGLSARGSRRSGIDIPELGISIVVNDDGPAGWINWSDGTRGSNYAYYCSETVLASTWSKELAYQKGRAIGNEALFGNGGAKSRFPGWYAPAVNIHRSPFSGRNFEYYSEDGLLSGMLAAEVVKGAQDKGVFCYVKHFGVNDQESNRCGLATWASEQSMREIYFKGFELVVKIGKTRAIMSALNRIGAVWTGGSYELLTNVLRNEWGFVGTVVTDSFLGGLSQADQMIRAGGDLALGNGLTAYQLDSATTLTALRNTAHNILYTHANSMAMNTGYSTLPYGMNPYSGSLLTAGILDVVYRADVGTATLNRDLLGENADDSLIKYSLKEGDSLPKGLELLENGIITGTPTEEINNHKFNIVASYQTYSREAMFTISIIDPNGSIIYQSEQDLPLAMIGEEYSGTVAYAEIFKPDATPTEIENFPNITYSIKNSHFLPDGLTLDAEGTITGTPTKECKDYQFVVVASAIGYKDAEIVWTINVYNDLEFGTRELSIARFGTMYIDNVAEAISDKTVTYRLKEGSSLPKGLTLTKGGIISGTPEEVKTNHVFVVQAVAEFAEVKEAEYSITIKLAYNEVKLTDAESGGYYDASVAMAQGARGVKYSVKQGSTLPEGLELSDNGELSGTPTKAGIYKFVIVASADGVISDEVEIQLFVAGSIQEPSHVGVKVVMGVCLAGGLVGICVLVFFILKKKKVL